MRKTLVLFCIFFFQFETITAENNYSSPEKTYYAALIYIKNTQWENLYYCFTSESTDMLEKITKNYMSLILFLAKKPIPDPAKLNQEFQNLTGKDFFVKLLNYAYDQNPKAFKFEKIEINDFEINNDEASTVLEYTDKRNKTRKDKLIMVKIQDKWLIDITYKLRKYR